MYPTRVEMEEKFEEAKRFALVLHEDLKSDIALIAEHLADGGPVCPGGSD